MYSSDPTVLTGLTVAGVPTMGMPTIPVGAHTYFVSSVTGSAGYPGTSLDQPKATLAQAIALAVTGDVIVLLSGHAETVSGAAGIAINVAGIQIVGMGTGAKRPTFTFATSTAATITMTAANVSLTNIIGITSVDQVVSPFVVSAANVTLGLEWRDGSAILEALRAVLTTAAADNFTLNLVYKGYTAGSHGVNAVRLVGGRNATIFVDYYGIVTTAVVEFGTTAVVDAQIEGYFYVSGTTDLSKNVVDTITGSTWFAYGYDGAAGTAYTKGSASGSGPAGALVATADGTANTYSRDVIGNKTDAAVTAATTTKSIMAYVKGLLSNLIVATVDGATNAFSRDVTGNKTDAAVYVPGATNSNAAYAKGTANLQEKVALKAAATMVTGQTIFTIAGGPIAVLGLVSICVTGNDGTASTLKYTAVPTSGSSTDVSAASASLASALAGASITLAGTALSTAALLSATGPNLIANPGTVVIPAGVLNITIATGSTTGTWAHYIRYRPLAVGVTVV